MMSLHNVRQELTIKRQKSKCHGGNYRRFIASDFIDKILFFLTSKTRQQRVGLYKIRRFALADKISSAPNELFNESRWTGELFIDMHPPIVHKSKGKFLQMEERVVCNLER